jgi:hypothetical protein
MCWTQPHTNNTNNVNKICAGHNHINNTNNVKLVLFMWLCPAHILFTLFVFLCVVVSSTYLIYVICVVCVWWCPAHILFTLFVLFVRGGVQHILAFL